MTLGQRIQELRKQNGLSQEGLGEALGVSRQAVSKWEGDNGIPELDTLIAMSRLFGITIGELLGVEEAVPAAEPAEAESDRLEAILQTYISETQTHQPPTRKFRWEWIAIAAAFLTVVVVVQFSQIRSMRTTVRQLQNQVGSLEVQVSNNLNNLSGQIRNSIYDILEEQSQLLSTFDWQAVEVDLEKQEVTVRLNTTMKAYPAGSKVQFLLDWKKVDETIGKTVSDWVDGPDFSAEVTLPMSYHTDVTVRAMDADGNVQEQLVDTFYDLHPENLQLHAYNLMEPFAITTTGFGVTGTTAKSENPEVDIFTIYPQLFRPEEAVITAIVNGETVFSEQMILPDTADEHGGYGASIADGYFDMTLVVGDTLEVKLEVTDNFGRTQTFAEGGTVVYVRGSAPRLEHTPMAAPVVGWE